MPDQVTSFPAAGQSGLDSPLVVHVDGWLRNEWALEEREFGAIGARFVASRAADEDELIANARHADALIVVVARISRRVLEGLPKLRAIVRTGVGYDTIDLAAATERGVAVCNIPDYCVDEVANHALALLLAVNRRLVQQDAHVRAGGWRGGPLAPMGPLTGETVGIIGYGRIGRAVAARCRAFGLRVIAADPYTGPPEPGDEIVPLDDLLARADYVTIHTPLSAETQGLIGEAQLRRMKPTAILVNTARGPIVDQRALTRALQEGWIAGAGLDVLEKEPPAPGEPILSLPNVVLTAHIGHFSDASTVRLRERVIQEVVTALSGHRPPGLVNAQVWRE